MRIAFMLVLASQLVPYVFVCAAESSKPNIIVILADDLGRELLSSYGGESYKTPALDRLGKQGMQFNTCYATPMCAPSRVELLTGRYSFRNYTAWERLDPQQITFAQLLRDAGYATAMAGKWHPMGAWSTDTAPPVKAGFAEYLSYDSKAMAKQAQRGHGNRFWGGTVLRNGKPERLDGYGPEAYSDFLVEFMRRHRDQPFLLLYSMTLMHRPFQPTPAHPKAPRKGMQPPKTWLGSKGSPENFEPMLRCADRLVGKIVAAVDELDLSDNTIILFTADNGTDNVHEARPVRSRFMGQMVRGGKYFPTELGVSVPLLVRWPERVAAGASCDELVDFTDVLPTLCDAAGVDLPANYHVDGRSFLPLMRGERGARKQFVFTWGNFENNSSKYKAPAQNIDKLLEVVRNERWKLYSDDRLFDLSNDYLEQRPVTRSASPAADAARQSLAEQRQRLRATLPKRW